MGAETEFKNWWRKRYKGLSDVHEPRRSIGEGFPDVTVLDKGSGLLLPIEFKIGWWDEGRLMCKFEPAQPAWHINFMRAGGRALICVGVANKKSWDVYQVIPGMWLMEWEKGIPPHVTTNWTLWSGG